MVNPVSVNEVGGILNYLMSVNVDGREVISQCGKCELLRDCLRGVSIL